jgi:adenine deaminase
MITPSDKFAITGNIVDIFRTEVYPAEIVISGQNIESIRRSNVKFSDFILPGLIDSHIHIESSMLTPSGFASLAVRHGTVAVVADPHEIANVAGSEGVIFMIENGKTVPFKFFFGAPSCVPATDFESAGGRIGPEEIEKLLMRDDIYFLSEMMNFPGVVSKERDIMHKIAAARKLSKPVDGHAPGLSGKNLKLYIGAGISTDHECVTLHEAEEKISGGMKIQIREGSAAKGFDLLCNLIDRFPDKVMLCTDDMHPDDLIKGHITSLLSRGIKKGLDLFNLIKASSLNIALHYNLPVGMLRAGDFADMVIVKDLEDFNVRQTYVNGEKVFDEGNVMFEPRPAKLSRKFRAGHVSPHQLRLVADADNIRIIEARDGELTTGSKIIRASIEDGCAIADPGRDICKIVVINRYKRNKPSVGFISGFGLKKGAIASSVAHDSHNIIAVGVNDTEISDAINLILEQGGGLAAVSENKKILLKLEIAGLMTNRNGKVVAQEYSEIENFARSLGSSLKAPFMSLSFMALLVIPELKIGDRGLFDVNSFGFTPVFVK